MGDLLPCPFCSRAPLVESSDDGEGSGGDSGEGPPVYWISCPCGLEGPMFDSDYEARTAWNTRATPKPRRDPLTDPRPGDVVRFRESAHPEYGFTVAEISQRFLDVVTIAYTGDHDPERVAVDAWSDWSDFTVEVLHTAPDEVTP